MVKLKDAHHVIAAADFKTVHSWLLKLNLIDIGGLRIHTRIAPGLRRFSKTVNFGLSKNPALRPFFGAAKKGSPVRAVCVALAA